MEKQLVKFARDGAGNMTYEPFEANGKRFKFIKPGDPIGVEKWGHYNTLTIVVGAGVTFADLINGLTAHQKLLAGDRPHDEKIMEAIVWSDHMKRGLIDLSKSRFDKAFYLASLFIYRDGADPYEWSEEIAECMIEDWAVGRVDEQDLFFFAMSLVEGWSETLKELQAQAGRDAARSLVDFILRKAKS